MKNLPETQHSLLIQLRENSSVGWATFLEIYQKAIYDFCRRKGLQDADADDVTQEVLAAVSKRVATWDNDPAKGTFRGWLYRVARNIAVNSLLARGRRAVTGGGTEVQVLLEEHVESEDAQSTLFHLEYRRAMMNWAAKIVKPTVNENSWNAFWRTAVQGENAKDVAAELGMNVGGVYTAKCRVFAKMKEVIGDLSDESTFDQTEREYE